MESVIYNPLAEYESKYKSLHREKTVAFLDNLVKESGISIEENRKTVAEYNTYKENIKKLRKKFNRLRFLRVLLILLIILVPFGVYGALGDIILSGGALVLFGGIFIPVIIKKLTPSIRKLREDIEQADKKASELLSLAYEQMKPLNELFCENDSVNLVEDSIPLLTFNSHFSSSQQEDMKVNYDFATDPDAMESTMDVLSGYYNENPFLFENKIIHTMGEETYHGYKTITWTETYRDSSGKLQRRARSQTLHASVIKPKPFYHTQVVLDYGSQGAPDLCFSRDATHLDRKSEKALERYVERGEKRIKRKTDRAIKGNDDFMSMSNTEFEVIFDALDRTDEVQFRTLFTPLAQTNMVDILLSESGYGDDFGFIKQKRMNFIISKHSQGRKIKLVPDDYKSYSYDIIEENFVSKNEEFFRAVYFDFAPLWSVPAYQERPIHSLKPLPEYSSIYAQKECEALLNMVDASEVVHPDTKTQAIIRSSFVKSQNSIDEISVLAYSYDIEPRQDVIPVLGGDGHYHNVIVPWDEYIPLESQKKFFVAEKDKTDSDRMMATRNNLCIFN